MTTYVRLDRVHLVLKFSHFRYLRSLVPSHDLPWFILYGAKKSEEDEIVMRVNETTLMRWLYHVPDNDTFVRPILQHKGEQFFGW